MQVSVSNIMDELINIVERNRTSIDELVQQYQPKRRLTVYKGMRVTLPLDAYPSLELEPTTAGMEWLTTEAQTNTYGVQFMLTVNNSNDAMGAEYITMLAREFTALYNHPGNMSFTIPGDYLWNPAGGAVAPAVVQFGSVSSATFNATKDGSLRVAQWDWSGQVIEGFPRDWWNKPLLSQAPGFPRELPPVQQR